MAGIRYSMAISFLLTLAGASYLGFGLVSLEHDKLLHFVTFLLLTVEFFLIFNTSVKTLRLLSVVTFITCTLFGGIGLEFVQSQVNPGRIFDTNDIYCNLLGSLVGIVIGFAFQVWYSKKLKADRLRYKRIRHAGDGGGLGTSGTSGAGGSNGANGQENEDYVNIELKDVSTV